MFAWPPFLLGDEIYDLTHLHPRQVTYIQQAKDTRPERRYKVQVFFGLHCFTRSPAPGEVVDPVWHYSDNRETRVFCVRRWALSKLLPAVVEGLAERSCYHTGKGNFVVIELVDEAGFVQEYEVYFAASRAAGHNGLNLYVQSAYVRDTAHANRPKRKSIRLQIILYNTLNNKAIKAPPH
ncbi:Conserved hypothethical protein [Cupriavidus necator]|uniref:Conserved hypothethical protein n=1 Tax=Cupriavidus necator TaxID=106590 RepID=A0A1K0I8E0_CUPNE|nr:Conserved hypothethical protein [Cupriavidus necator]